MPARTRTVDQRRRTFALAMLGNGLPIALSVLHDVDRHPPGFFWGAAIALVAPLAVVMGTAPRWRPVRWPLQYGGVVGLTMMQAHSGGPSSPYALLLVMPALWFGATLHGGELRTGLALMIGCCFLPMIVVGGPAYPVDPIAGLVLALIVSGVIRSLALFTRETDRLTARLRNDATHDRLTRLLNRRGWEEAIERCPRSGLDGAPPCLVLVDLDGLKAVNDSAGHDEGDRLIRETGDRLETAFGAEEAAARLGGDEFAVLLRGVPVDRVLARLTALRLSTPPEGAFSAGVAVVAPHEEIGDALRRADLALYDVKRSGRGRDLLAPAGALPAAASPAAV